MIGTVVANRYEVIRDKGGDGVFDTFQGREKSSGKDVFIRSVKPEVLGDSEFLAELGSVVASLRAVKHQGVERILAFERSDDQAVLVAEYFEGSSLENRLRRLANFSVPVAVKVAIEICEALGDLHKAGIVHGDISPQTIFTTQNEQVKLVSPGFWKAYSHSEKAARAKVRQMAPYLAPEVTAGSMPSELSDVYAVGVLLWQMLAGRVPYHGDSPASIAAKHASGDYPSLRTEIPAVPEALDKVIQKAMEKNPLHRYVTVQRLLSDLRTVQDALRFGRPLSWPLKHETGEVEETKVAPTLNAVDAEPKDEPDPKKKRKEKDVSDSLPLWLSGLVYLMSTLVLVIIGAWVFFNLQKPKTLVVPDLVGKSADIAREELQSMQLELRVLREQTSDTHPRGAIISLAPAAGAEIKEGSKVNAIVSSGSRFVDLPDFRGMELSEVRELIAELNLRLEQTDIEYVRDRELPKNFVLSQTPEPLLKVERYTRVKLTLSNGNERVRGSSNTNTPHQRIFELVMPDEVEGAVEVKVEVTDGRGRRTLYENNHFARDDISFDMTLYGDSALFRVFFDGELATTYSEDLEEEE